MRRWLVRFSWMALGIGGLYGGFALAGVANGGPLNPPPGTPASTYKSLATIPGSWFDVLPADDTGDPCNSARFACVMDGEAVLDLETGLVWQRSPSGVTVTWLGAKNTCERDAVTGGRRGWRLPTIAEVASLIEPGVFAFPPVGHPFGGILDPSQATSGSVWTSEHVSGLGVAYAVGVGNGAFGVTPFSDAATLRVLCVRGAAGGTSLIP